MATKRILSISYDAVLLNIRQQLLEQNGYAVTSVEGFAAAMDRCRDDKFDLVIMGHSIPLEDREALLQAVRETCAAPVIALVRRGESALSGATAFVDPMEPMGFLQAVKRLTGGTDRPASRDERAGLS